MARINLEESIFKEDRFIELCIAAGGRINGIGALVCLWIEAQKHYLKSGCISNEAWVLSGLPEYLITTKWAERTPNGIRAKGQDEQFAWLTQRSQAGKSRSESKTKNLKQNVERPFDNKPNETERNRTDTEPPFSLLSSPLSSSKLITQSLHSKEPPTPKGEWACLIEIYNANRGVLPEAKCWNPSRERQAKMRWKENPSKEKWEEAVKYYSSSPHHVGKNDMGWMASFDFILQQGRWLQAIEAKTAGKIVSANPRNRSEMRMQNNRDAAEAYMEKLKGESNES